MPGVTEKVLEKLPEPSCTSSSSSCGSHGGDENDPATNMGGIVPGFEYVMVNVEGGMVAAGKHAVLHRLFSDEKNDSRYPGAGLGRSCSCKLNHEELLGSHRRN